MFSPSIDAESKVGVCVFLFSEDEGEYIPPVRVCARSRRLRFLDLKADAAGGAVSEQRKLSWCLAAEGRNQE